MDLRGHDAELAGRAVKSCPTAAATSATRQASSTPGMNSWAKARWPCSTRLTGRRVVPGAGEVADGQRDRGRSLPR